MARDLFQEAGISPSTQGGRDLFAEAGIDAAPESRSVLDIVSGGIDSVVSDVRGGFAARDKRKRDKEIARSAAAAAREIEFQSRSGTASELQAMAEADANRAKYENSAGQAALRGVNLGRDMALGGVKGVIGLGESAVGLGDLATGWTGWTPGQGLKDVAGYDPGAAKNTLDTLKSDAGKARDAIYESTKGFTDTLLTLGTHPGILADKIAESLVSTVGAGVIGGKVVQMALPKVTAAAQAAGLTGPAAEAFITDKLTKIAIGASAGAEGAQQAGNLAETARQGGREWQDYVIPAVASGLGTAAIGAVSGRLAQKAGVGDVEADIAMRGMAKPGGVKTDPGNLLSRAAVEGFKEGALEEMPQSAQEAAWENVAMGRPWDQGLGKAAATGLATGFGMGGGHAALSRPGTEDRGGAGPGGAPPTGVTAPDQGISISAADVLGTQAGEVTEAEKALYTPKSLTALDRVTEIDAKLAAPDITQEVAAPLVAERDSITASWPKATPGAQTSFTTETGARLDGQYALIEVGDLTTSHDENLRPVQTYPAELQPRERERHASEMQIQQIVGRLDPARLGESADVATGAPIVGADGLVESGNARTIALKRIYQANGQKALDYKAYIKANADRFGIAPESVDALQKPVLVRVRATPVNRAEFARQANQATVARMSPSEQARSDAAQIDSLDDLNPNEAGDFTSGNSSPFVRRFMAKLPATEQAGLVDSAGQLSQAGYQRIRNAVLAKAYGDSPVLQRMVESLDSNNRNVGAALMRVAPQVAKTREAIHEGALHDADLTPDLMAAVEELSALKDKGTSVTEALAQAGMFGDKLTPESRDLLAFMDANIRSPKRIADFIQSYLDALQAAGNPAQGSMFGDTAAPAKVDLIAAARRIVHGEEPTATGGAAAGNTADAQAGGRQPENPEGNQAGARSDETSDEWLTFPPDTGTLGIPRAEMPQIKGEQRGALIQFLKGRGINHETVDTPASQLKPSQAEFSMKKVEGWANRRDDSERSVLASSDGYILDGHHQWVAALAAGETEKVIRFDVPMQELLAAAREFPSVKKSEGAPQKGKTEVRREIIEQQWNEALGELGVILRDFARAARLVPEDTPNLMPTLVKLFEAGFGKVGMKTQDLMRYVKDELKKLPEFKTVWNKITAATYRKAAEQALANHQAAPQGDLFAPRVEQAMQRDLFAQPAEKAGAGKVAMIVIDGNEYDLDAPNFGLAAWPETLPADSPLLIDSRKHETGIWNGIKVSRQQMHDEIVRDAFVDAVPPQGRAPIAYVMGGGGASGKGTIRNKLVRSGRISLDGAVVLDPDEVKEHIPEYKAIRLAGDSRGAAVVHEESSAIAKRIISKAVDGKYDIVYDATLGNLEKGKALLQRLKDAGYEVRMFGVTTNPMVAVVRANSRARGSYRYVPISELLKAHKGFAANIESYAKLADQFMLYENSDTQILVAEKAGDSLDISDQAAYNEVVERSHINDRARTLREVLPGSQKDARFDERGRLAGSQEGNGRNAGRPSGSFRERATDAEGARDTRTTVSGSGLGDEGGDSQSESRSHQEGGLNEPDRNDSASGTQGEGPGPARGTSRQRGTQRFREGEGGDDLFSGDFAGARDGAEVRVQQDGRPDGKGQDNERRPAAGKGDRAGRTTGIPAGRDIPAKSGRNYRFTDADLNYAGGWQAKARQNVEAVELAKKLEAEGRQATREEQAILAKFIGWGASEIRNTIFGDKIDKQLAALADYDEAIANLGDRPYLTNARYSEYRPAFELLQAKNPALNWYTAGNITRAMLDAAKPDAGIRKWGALRDRLKAVLTDEEWATAERSTQYAHYTSRAVVQSMWKAMERMGFKGGAILEPGAGIGVFPGLMDSAVANNSVYTGIEYDALTGAILKQLFPDERILTESFVDSALPDEFYDVAIGNPPFANVKVLADPKYKKHAFSLHDYFFAKSIDKVKPGGLMVYVTSRYTMDKLDDKARKYLAERADLVGAIRLPQTAFQKNAGTEVVTDVIFLRKKVKGQTFEYAQPWTGTGEVRTDKEPALVNEYFAAHPEMVLGKHSRRGSMYSKDEYTVLPNEGDIEAQFAAAVENLPQGIYRATGEAAQAAQVREIDFNPKADKETNYYINDAGVLMQREGGVGVRADVGKGEKTVALLKDFVKLRDALKQSHYDQLNDGPWEDSLKALQKEYRAFVKKNGNILQNRAFERKVAREDEETGQVIEDVVISRRFDLLNKINDDTDYTLVEALETLNEETGQISESKFLHERFLAKPAPPQIDTPHDALLSGLNDVGRVDIPLIAERLGISEREAIAALGDAIYESPSAGWQMADEYLSGNVKQKLKEAQEAAKTDRRFERNIEALISAQPAPVPPSDITPAIGMNWIPANVYEQFLEEKTGVRATVIYNERTNNWTVTAQAGHGTVQATADWGTLDRNAADILDHALTGRNIRVTRMEGTGADRKPVFDPAATEAANQKLVQMRAAFADWLWQDGERTDTLVRIYNDKFNTLVARKFDGRHLTLPGSTTTINVFDHVKRGAWRIIQSGNAYLAHAVGSGKTWQMVISAMEQKRLGLIKKPLCVVPNHMLQQFAREWLQLYPTARLMVADEKQFHTDHRRRFVSRVALSDLDGVIITHSAFKLLDLDPEFKRGMIEQQLDYLRAALEEVGGEDGKKSRDPRVRDIQNRIEKMEQKLEAAMSGAGKDKNVRFDQLGVDMLYVDEAHEFRKLAFATTRQVKGIDSSGSDRAFDLWMKTRWLEQKKPGRSLVMASGTPITNTLAEIYSVQRFMAPQVLEERGLQDFDAWASMFGQENTEIESDASGKYAPVTRFTKFVNVPELTQMFREFSDVLTSDHLAEMLGDKRPKIKDGSRKLVITPQTDEYTAYKAELADRLAESRAWKPSRDEPNNPDPVIKIIGDGRLAAIDMRFVDPSLPSNPDSKLNRVIDGVIEVHKRTANMEYPGKDGKVEPVKGGAQMVFSDLGFGAGVTAHRGFNARAWLEKRLRDAGIPANQIAFMSDHKKSVAKLKLFQDVNAGRVRILVGSSKNMGTGVNAQQRLVALHHLDTPWYPADLEQREGRIVRQGNKNPLVELYAYSTKGSYDTVMWQMLASKQKFIDQALSGDSSVRSIDDLTEASQFQMATAMTADDPRAIQLAGLKADIEKYQRLFRSHEETRARLRREYDLAERFAVSATNQLPDAEKLADKVQNLSGDNFKAKADSKTFDKRKEWAEALLASFKNLAAHGKDGNIKVGEISGFLVEFHGQILRDSGGTVKQYSTDLILRHGDTSTFLAHSPDDDAVGMSMRATNALAAVARKPAELKQRIEDAKAKRAALVDRLDAKFQFSGELADKIKEADALEAAMVTDSKAAEQKAEEPKLSRRTKTESPEFKAWFGDSKVVDADGKPLVVYHGTSADFAVFSKAVPIADDEGFFFTVDPKHAGAYAGARRGSKIIPVYLSIRDPLELTSSEWYNNKKNGRPLGTPAEWAAAGYDGLLIRSLEQQGGQSDTWVAFRPEQIKSAIGNTGAFSATNPNINMSRGSGRGMALRDLQAVADRVAKGFKNLPRVHVMASPADLSTKDPTQKALRDFIRKSDAWDDVEGATHEGEIYLFASGMADEARAEHVLATHELTHYGLRGAVGKDLDSALQHVLLMNAKVRKAAIAVKKTRGLKSNIEAVEEVLADIPTADLAKLRGWRKVVQVVRNWLNKAGAVKLADQLDQWMKAGLSDQEKADLFVADLVGAAREWVRTGKGGNAGVAATGGTKLAKIGDGNNSQGGVTRLSLAVPPASTPDDILDQKAGTRRPLDAVVKGATQALRIDRLTAAAYDKAAGILDRYTPEVIKAGMVSDYGVPEAVIDRRALMEGRQRRRLRGVGTLLEKLATLTRAESRVAYEWINNDDPQAAEYFEQQLPEESVEVLKEVRDLIDQLSQEAIRLGQLSQEAYERNKFAYLRRSYVKHTAELTGGEARGRARAIAILGDQYKGRGMSDAVDMAKFKNIAPEWWNRKLKDGQADKQLKGEEFFRLERRAASGEGTTALQGFGEKGKGRLLEVAYWPAGEPIPAKFSTWDQAGTWEVRDTKGGKLVVWRDFTKQEREAMGEIDESRYAIAKTLHGMIHDVEVGNYLEWLGQKYAKKDGDAIDGALVEASEHMRDTFTPGEWVQVPDTKIPGTQVKKYGTLAGRYLPGPIWNDVRQMGGRFKPLGDTYAALHRAWKVSKTALSPAVHTNNVMANFVMADWHDVTAGHVLKALKLMVSKDPAAADVLARFGDSGGTIGTWATKELQQEQLRPLLEALEKELGVAGNISGQVGVMSALQLALKGRLPSAWDALKPSKPGQATVRAARAMIDLYEAEDQVFRLSAWLRAKEEGASDLQAGKAARKSFLDYSINAPWVQMMRQTAFPFIAFTYRSVPMLLETAAKKPWKLMKLGLVAATINALGYMLSGGDEDDERKLLPEEKAGRIWGLTPKLIRMPWNDGHGAPVFLDVRRWIPVGDIFDTGQTHSALPVLPMMQPGGPLMLLAEFALDKTQFTGRGITLETDTPLEKATKTADWLYKAFAPNIIALPGTYAWTAIANAGSGKTDSFGREQSLAQAVVSSFGIKVGSYPKDVLQLNAQREAQAKLMEIDRNIAALKREYQKNGIDADEFQEKADDQVAKKRKVVEKLQERMAGG